MKLVKGTFLTGIFLSTLVLAASGLSENPAQAQLIIDPAQVQLINPIKINRLSYRIDELAVLKQEVYDQVNQYRATQGLPPLQLDSRISDQEQTYAQTMAEAGYPLNHQGVSQRAEVVRQAIPHSSYSYRENEYFCYGDGCSATAAVQWWLSSPAHRANILGQYELTGIGVAKDAKGQYFFAQMFLHTQ